MKLKMRFMAFATVVAMAATGCVKDNPGFTNGPEPGSEDVGYLDISSLTAQVMLDAEIETQSATRAEGDETRTYDEVGAEYLVSLYRAADNVAIFENVQYGDLASRFTATDNLLELETGSYNLMVKSVATPPAVSYETGYYGTDPMYNFEITRAHTQDAPLHIADQEVVCKLQNVKVSVELSAELTDPTVGGLKDDYEITVTMVGNEGAVAEFNKNRIGEANPAYLQPTNPAGSNTLELVISGIKGVGDAAAPAVLKRSIEDVKKGQWRKINISVTYSTTGEVYINVSVDTYVLDNTIEINTTEKLEEPTISDGSDLALTWEGHDLATEVYKASDADYDENGLYTANNAPVLKMASKNGIQSMLLTVTSTNADFEDVAEKVDLCGTAASIKPTLYRPWRITANATTATIDFNEIMDDFFALQGDYTFTFDMVDVKGKKATATLKMTYGAAKDPSITCAQVTFGEAANVAELEELVVNISTPSGIQALEVTIEAEGALGGALAEMGMAEPFNLCDVDPVNEKILYDNLTSPLLNFPVNDAVIGKTELPFPLTDFLGMLGAFPGTHVFTLSVTNTEGKNTTEKLVLLVE